MRTMLLLLAACTFGSGCASSPREAAPATVVKASAMNPIGERWPREEEARSWTITMDEAIRIGKEHMGDPERVDIYRASPVVRGEEQFWRVTRAGIISGGWEADIDARTGAVMRTQRPPSR